MKYVSIISYSLGSGNFFLAFPLFFVHLRYAIQDTFFIWDLIWHTIVLADPSLVRHLMFITSGSRGFLFLKSKRIIPAYRDSIDLTWIFWCLLTLSNESTSVSRLEYFHTEPEWFSLKKMSALPPNRTNYRFATWESIWV